MSWIYKLYLLRVCTALQGPLSCNVMLLSRCCEFDMAPCVQAMLSWKWRVIHLPSFPCDYSGQITSFMHKQWVTYGHLAMSSSTHWSGSTLPRVGADRTEQRKYVSRFDQLNTKKSRDMRCLEVKSVKPSSILPFEKRCETSTSPNQEKFICWGEWLLLPHFICYCIKDPSCYKNSFYVQFNQLIICLFTKDWNLGRYAIKAHEWNRIWLATSG